METQTKPKRPRSNPSDSYLTKLITYIPTEIIAAYVAISGFIKGIKPPEQFSLFWFVAAFLLIVTPIYILYAADIKGKPSPLGQAAASFFAFAAWVFATGGPFNQFLYDAQKNPTGWYQPLIGSVVLVLVCICLPLIEWFIGKMLVGISKSKPAA